MCLHTVTITWWSISVLCRAVNSTCFSSDLYLQLDKSYTSFPPSNKKETCSSQSAQVMKTYPGKSWQASTCYKKLFRSFRDGRDGDLKTMYANRVGLYKCSQGDDVIQYSLDMCCPGNSYLILHFSLPISRTQSEAHAKNISVNWKGNINLDESNYDSSNRLFTAKMLYAWPLFLAAWH